MLAVHMVKVNVKKCALITSDLRSAQQCTDGATLTTRQYVYRREQDNEEQT